MVMIDIHSGARSRGQIGRVLLFVTERIDTPWYIGMGIPLVAARRRISRGNEPGRLQITRGFVERVADINPDNINYKNLLDILTIPMLDGRRG